MLLLSESRHGVLSAVKVIFGWFEPWIHIELNTQNDRRYKRKPEPRTIRCQQQTFMQQNLEQGGCGCDGEALELLHFLG